MLHLAQHAPRNWLGQQFAQVARRLVLRGAPLPLDVAVGPIRMRCYLRDNNSERKFAFMPWRFDRRERQCILEALPADGVFVDIGANVGIHTLAAAVHMNAHGRILALEPNPPAFERLRFNLEATRHGRPDWPTVELLRLGVADKAGEIELHLEPTNLGSSSIVPRAPARPGTAGVVRIPCRPLLSILRERGIERMDALKIDIEGAEDLALLPYLAQAADASLPTLIVIENSEQRWTLDLVGALAGRGYRVLSRTRMNTVYRRERAAHDAQPSPPAGGFVRHLRSGLTSSA